MAQNRTKPALNPFTNELQIINDLEMGFTVRNVAKAPFVVMNGYTRVYPNLCIPDDMTIEVQDGGELIVL
jgi:hypothetical protein